MDVAPNSFTDQMVTVEQMIPLSGKNRSRARIAAAEAVRSLEELRRAELDVTMKTRTAFIQLVNLRALLELNRANERSLMQTVEISRARFEVGDAGAGRGLDGAERGDPDQRSAPRPGARGCASRRPR